MHYNMVILHFQKAAKVFNSNTKNGRIIVIAQWISRRMLDIRQKFELWKRQNDITNDKSAGVGKTNI